MIHDRTYNKKSNNRSTALGRSVITRVGCLIEIPVLKPNNVEPDQTPHSAASDQVLHCFANVPFMGR